jgi:hypothetical protein
MSENKQISIFFIILFIWVLASGQESIFPGVPLELGNYKYLLAAAYLGLATFFFKRKKV